MNPIKLLALLMSAPPAARDLAAALVRAIQSRDEAAVRKATEAALRLVFELRQK